MPVQGYNVIPDVNDHESVIGVEIEQGNELLNGKACVYIGEGYGQTEIHLTHDELQAFIAQARTTLNEMEWAQATFVYAQREGSFIQDTHHLMHKGDDKTGKSLCGKLPPTFDHEWRLEPVIGDPRCNTICKVCYAKWQKLQQQSAA